METTLKMREIRNLFFKVASTQAQRWKRNEESKVTSVNLKGDIRIQQEYVFEGDGEAGNELFKVNPEEIIMRKQYEGRLYEIWLSKDERYQLKQMQLGLLITGTEVFDNKIFKDIMYMFFKDIADEKTFKEAEMYLL